MNMLRQSWNIKIGSGCHLKRRGKNENLDSSIGVYSHGIF